MERAAPRTLLLTERVSRECRLSAADVRYLLDRHRGHVEVAPTGRRRRYRLTALGHVGVIVAPSCRLVIRPKVPLQNLFDLLDPDAEVSVTEDRASLVPGSAALHFLASRLALLLAERAAAGLHRGYAERAQQGPFLQGRIDVPAQLQGGAGRKDVIHSRYEDFTADVPCNQVPRATAERVLRSPLLGEEVRAALRLALQGYESVTAGPLGPDSFGATAPDRLTEAYRPLLDVCRLLAEGLDPGGAAGAASCPAFLLDMERVFEQYVTRGVQRAFAGRPAYSVAVQPRFVASRPVAGQPDVEMQPDVTVGRGGQTVLVVDAKWKRLKGAPLVTEDLYQVLAYCTALGAGRAVLVYPGRRDRAWEYALTRAPVIVVVRTLRVVGPRDALRRSLRRLGRALITP